MIPPWHMSWEMLLLPGLVMFGFGYLARCCCPGEGGGVVEQNCGSGTCIDGNHCSVYMVEVAGIANDDCTQCEDMNGTYLFDIYPSDCGGEFGVFWPCGSSACVQCIDLETSHCNGNTFECFNRAELRFVSCSEPTNHKYIQFGLTSLDCKSGTDRRYLTWDELFVDEEIDCLAVHVLGPPAGTTWDFLTYSRPCDPTDATATITPLCD